MTYSMYGHTRGTQQFILAYNHFILKYTGINHGYISGDTPINTTTSQFGKNMSHTKHEDKPKNVNPREHEPQQN